MNPISGWATEIPHASGQLSSHEPGAAAAEKPKGTIKGPARLTQPKINKHFKKKKDGNVLLIFLETGASKTQALADSASGVSLLPGSQTVIFSLYPHMVGGLGNDLMPHLKGC